MNPVTSRLSSLIQERGWQSRLVPINRLDDLRRAISDRHEQGLIDDTLYRDQLAAFSFARPSDLPETRSILIVAVPTPQMRVIFHNQGKRMPVVIPPTYVSYTPRTETVQGILASWMRQEGYQLARPRLPLKTLAVCSGLAEYGRNNICFVPGMGSFLQLVGAFTDIPCESDPWREPKALDRCDSCVACMRLCPTGAITADRFLLHAEHCLTYHNEAANNFPNWIDPSWHHCLIGCMRCQTACPENKKLLGWFEDRAEFSDRETELFLQHVPFDRLPSETAKKMKRLEINEDYRLLCRNLAMILSHR